MLPGVDHAGLFRVCYEPPDTPGSATPGDPSVQTSATAVQILEQTTNSTAAVISDGAPTDPVATSTNGDAADPVATEDNRLTNTTKIVDDIKEDIMNNLPFSKQSSEGCTDRVNVFFGDIWGEDYQSRFQGTAALAILYAIISAFKFITLVVSTVLCGDCFGEFPRGRSSLGSVTTIQVLAGWAAWLLFLWILLDIKSNDEAHDRAKEAGIAIDTKAAGEVQSYWGHSFWLFLASTLVTSIGGLFGCC